MQSSDVATALVPVGTCCSSAAADDAKLSGSTAMPALSYALPPPVDEMAEEARAELEAAVEEGIEMNLMMPVVLFDVDTTPRRRSLRMHGD